MLNFLWVFVEIVAGRNVLVFQILFLFGEKWLFCWMLLKAITWICFLKFGTFSGFYNHTSIWDDGFEVNGKNCTLILLSAFQVFPPESKFWKMNTKELREAASFVCTVEFWRMAILWTFSLIMSHLQLFMGRFVYVKQKVTSVPSSSSAVARPVCIITGVSGLLVYISSFSASFVNGGHSLTCFLLANYGSFLFSLCTSILVDSIS